MGKWYETFTEKMIKNLWIDDDCWYWGHPENRKPYPQIWVTGKGHSYVYREMYELFVGPIPDGYDIGHKCHDEAAWAGLCDGREKCLHKYCCRPDHLKPETRLENLLASPLTEAFRLIGKGKPVASRKSPKDIPSAVIQILEKLVEDV